MLFHHNYPVCCHTPETPRPWCALSVLCSNNPHHPLTTVQAEGVRKQKATESSRFIIAVLQAGSHLITGNFRISRITWNPCYLFFQSSQDPTLLWTAWDGSRVWLSLWPLPTLHSSSFWVPTLCHLEECDPSSAMPIRESEHRQPFNSTLTVFLEASQCPSILSVSSNLFPMELMAMQPCA